MNDYDKGGMNQKSWKFNVNFGIQKSNSQDNYGAIS